MLTDERMQELQAANAALTAALHLWRHWYAERMTLSTDEEEARLLAAASATLDALVPNTARDRLALERATVRALRKRVADVAHVEPGVPCTCPQCERDRELLAQWAALGVEAT